MAELVRFRVHFADATHVDVSALNTAEARRLATNQRPGMIVTKIKLLKERSE